MCKQLMAVSTWSRIHCHRTPGKALEERLNRDYGPGNPYYEDFCKYIKTNWKKAE